jgi:hypothetical protein
MRALPLAAFGLLMLAPLVAAESTEEAPPAWVDDCPPEHMCAFGGDPNEPRDDATGNGYEPGPDCDAPECVYKGGDCEDCEVIACMPPDCDASHFGAGDCIECSGFAPQGEKQEMRYLVGVGAAGTLVVAAIALALIRRS